MDKTQGPWGENSLADIYANIRNKALEEAEQFWVLWHTTEMSADEALCLMATKFQWKLPPKNIRAKPVAASSDTRAMALEEAAQHVERCPTISADLERAYKRLALSIRALKTKEPA